MKLTLLSTWWSSCCWRWVLTDAGHLLGVVHVGPPFTAQVIVSTDPTSGWGGEVGGLGGTIMQSPDPEPGCKKQMLLVSI